LIEVLALMPYYWLGFAAGTRVILKSGEWQHLKFNWYKRIRYFIVPILFVEIIGMLVFWFEYLGLTELDPAYVSIIVGANVFLVYVLNLLLGRFRTRMISAGVRRVYIGGVRFVTQKLPHPTESLRHTVLELLAMLVTVVGIVLATPMILK
jgi:type VI protein secretion system component VasK